MNKLEKLQNKLIGRATEIYTECAQDLSFFKTEYVGHYANLGVLVFEIKNYNTLGSLIDALYFGNFCELGIADDEDVDDLLGEIYN